MARTIGTMGRPGIGLTLLASMGFVSGCSAADEGPPELVGTTTAALTLTVPQKQAALNSFYSMDNTVYINITMPAAEWDALRTEYPTGPDGTKTRTPTKNNTSTDWRCYRDIPSNIDSFTTHKNVQVTIGGSAFLPASANFTGAEIKKKSYCGSFTGSLNEKPSLKLKLPSSAEDVLGSRYLILNNSKQDSSYIRQALGYKLFGLAGLPHSRSNFAKVYVNGVAQGDGVYVNVEPIRERFIDNPDNHFDHHDFSQATCPNSTTNQPCDHGNLYEFQGGWHSDDTNTGDDFKAARLGYIEAESLSQITSKADLTTAAAQIALDINAIDSSGTANVVSGMNKVIDVPEFIKLFAMEILLKHTDGYTGYQNNTYVYNDGVPSLNPGAGTSTTPTQIKFKLIPSGIDEILKSSSDFHMSDSSLLGRLVRHNPELQNKLRQQIQDLRTGAPFSRASLNNDVKPFIDLMASKLQGLGACVSGTNPCRSPTQAPSSGGLSEVDEVKKQLDLARSAAYIYGGFNPAYSGPYVLEKETGHALHASSTQHVGGSTSSFFEVVHADRQEDQSAEKWTFDPSPVPGFLYRVKSELSGSYLHASSSIYTSAGHLMLYTDPTAFGAYQDYRLYFDNPCYRNNSGTLVCPNNSSQYDYTGYFTMESKNGRFLHFGDDDATPVTGRQRVYQAGLAQASKLSWY